MGKNDILWEHGIRELKAINVFTEAGGLNRQSRVILRKYPGIIQTVLDLTSFLPRNTGLVIRLQHLLQNITAIPTCLTCGGPLKMRASGRFINTYSKFCKSKCFGKDKNVVAKRSATNLERYGNIHVVQSDEIKEKVKQTNLARYGVENPLLSSEIQHKVKQTNLARYGVENPLLSSEIQHKVKQTNLARYGVENPLLSSEIQHKVKQTNLRKYGVENPFNLNKFQLKARNSIVEKYGVGHALQDPIIRKKFTDTMKKFHGVEHALQDAIIRKKFTSTMVKKYGVEHALQDKEMLDTATSNRRAFVAETYGVQYYNQLLISPDSLELLNNRVWLQVEHRDNRKTLTDIAHQLDVSHSTVSLYFKKHDIEVLTHTGSQIERDIVEYISTIYTQEINTNDRTLIKPLELDIVLPDKKIAFEVNGTYWHSQLRGKDKQYHINKTKQAERMGYQLIHITDKEWVTQHNIVKSRIAAKLGVSKTVGARKTIIREVVGPDASEFFNQNHIQGACAASVRYGLYRDGVMIACMTFGKSRYNKKIEWELLRFANKVGVSVIGGASKLFTHFVKEHNPTSVISYSDKRWNTGKLYYNLGFDYSHTSPPNYRYFLPSDCFNTYPRIKFQKHKLRKLLGKFNTQLTEWQNMVINGYDRVWDCGNDVWVWQSH